MESMRREVHALRFEQDNPIHDRILIPDVKRRPARTCAHHENGMAMKAQGADLRHAEACCSRAIDIQDMGWQFVRCDDPEAFGGDCRGKVAELVSVIILKLP